MGIYMLFTLVLAILYCDETYEPVLLVRKARKLRILTHNWALHAKFEECDVSIAELTRKFMVRPWQILFTPIALAMNLYSAFVYGVFYLCLGAVSIIFEEGRGWNSVRRPLFHCYQYADDFPNPFTLFYTRFLEIKSCLLP